MAVGVTILSMLGKASVTGAFSASYVYTLELFPTGVRNNAMGSASMLARVSGMAAPYMGRPMVGSLFYFITFFFFALSRSWAVSFGLLLYTRIIQNIEPVLCIKEADI